MVPLSPMGQGLSGPQTPLRPGWERGRSRTCTGHLLCAESFHNDLMNLENVLANVRATERNTEAPRRVSSYRGRCHSSVTELKVAPSQSWSQSLLPFLVCDSKSFSK